MKNEYEILQDFEFLKKIVVGIGEVSEITNIPARQLRYWEDKGIITSIANSQAKNRRYDYLQIKKILLIKELLEEGYTLEAASHKVKARMETIASIFKKLKSED